MRCDARFIHQSSLVRRLEPRPRARTAVALSPIMMGASFDLLDFEIAVMTPPKDCAATLHTGLLWDKAAALTLPTVSQPSRWCRTDGRVAQGNVSDFVSALWTKLLCQ